jgi:hypothetical protein
MAECEIKVSWFWGEQETDLSKCTGCKEIIFGNMNVLIIQFGKAENLQFNDADVCLCQSCFDACSFNCH